MPALDSLRSAQSYWDTAANTYHQDFSGTIIGRTRRLAVWRRLDTLFRQDQRILELNCGTGIDAIHLARQGICLTACDLSPRMIDIARDAAVNAGVADSIDFRVLANEEISKLKGERFDGAFSNFAGLNCVEDLGAVASQLAELLPPGAPLLVCMTGRFVPWEIVWHLAHGRPRRAFQRRKGVVATGAVTVRYPSVKEICAAFAPLFTMRRWEGIGIAVPPSYLEHWARRFPRLIHACAAWDRCFGTVPVVRGLGDCVVIEFERVHAAPCP